MLLSSYQRLLRYCGGDNVLTDNQVNRMQLMTWLASVSTSIEHWLNRGIQLQTAFVEYFDVRFHNNEYYPYYIPVTNIESVYVDFLGMWTGGQSQLSDISYHAGVNGNSLVLIFARPFETKKGLQLTYDGGLASDATQSIYACTFTGTWTPGTFVYGTSSGSVGILMSTDNSTKMTVSVLYGIFQVGETLAQWDTEMGIGTSTATAVYNSATSLSLAEAYPEIVAATEIQIRYMKKNKDRFENAQITKDGSTKRRVARTGVDKVDNEIQPEAELMLGYLRRVAI
jgi:hypothetical protein